MDCQSSLQYKEVRGLSRGLELLIALNRMPNGLASTSELAQACNIHRTTAKRLLETLKIEGLVDNGNRGGQYRLSAKVRKLSDGFREEAWIEQVASPIMRQSVRDLMWPTDMTVARAGFMVIKESTHRWSMLSQHQARIDEQLPMLATAAGRAYLAACTPDQRAAHLAILSSRNDDIGEKARDLVAIEHLLSETRNRGFAMNLGEWDEEPDFSAIAVPLFRGDCAIGALNLIFPNGSVSHDALKEVFRKKLEGVAESIRIRGSIF